MTAPLPKITDAEALQNLYIAARLAPLTAVQHERLKADAEQLAALLAAPPPPVPDR